MKFVAISDIHIKSSLDERYDILLKFMKHEDSISSEKIFFLGDIFDLMVGDHIQYYEEYKDFFDLMIVRSIQGKKISYFEGNHDFHLEGFFDYLMREKGLINFAYHKSFYQERIGKRVMVFSHGDEEETGNYSYKIYKKIINNSFMKLLADEVLTYPFLKKLGNYLSIKSRKRNNDKYDNLESHFFIKEKYRKSIESFYEERSFDFFLCGHSHIEESYKTSRYEYFNCGFVPVTKSYIFYDGHSVFLKKV